MSESVPALLELRILVLTLGEAHHAGWWKSRFLSPTGLSFLERIYPRSTFAAAVRSASRAARAVHDANIGKGTVFHLFRLPRHLEREIDSELAARSNELVAHYQPLIADQAALLQALEAMGDKQPVPTTKGPVKLSLGSGELVAVMAAAYRQAFQGGTQVFPYFEDQRAKS